MSTTKNIPKLRFPEFKKVWEKKKLEDVGKIRMCKRIFNNQTSIIEDIPFYKIGTFGKEPDSFITNELFQEFKHKYSYPNVGDILISAAGTLGRTVVFDGNPSYFQDSNIVWIDNKEKLITNEFLYYIYKIVRYDSEGGTIQRLYNSIIYNAKFWKPSLPEQQKIASFLSTVDKHIEGLEKKKTLLETYKKGVMKKIFNQEIRFKDDNGNDFLDWEETTLGKLAKITTGDSNRSDSESFGEYMFFDRSVDIRMSSTYSFDAEAIIVAGEGKDFIPRYYNGKFGLHQRTYAIYDFINSDAKFLYYWIYYFRYFLLKTSVGSTMPSLRMNSFTKFPVSKPTKEEQVKISEFLSSIDNQIELLGSQIDKSKTWKKGLLQKMFV